MIVKCKFVPDRWGLYILPLVGVSWNMNTCGLRPAFWFGWLFWLVVIGIPAKKESGSTDTQQAKGAIYTPQEEDDWSPRDWEAASFHEDCGDR